MEWPGWENYVLSSCDKLAERPLALRMMTFSGYQNHNPGQVISSRVNAQKLNLRLNSICRAAAALFEIPKKGEVSTPLN